MVKTLKDFEEQSIKNTRKLIVIGKSKKISLINIVYDKNVICFKIMHLVVYIHT